MSRSHDNVDFSVIKKSIAHPPKFRLRAKSISQFNIGSDFHIFENRQQKLKVVVLSNVATGSLELV